MADELGSQYKPLDSDLTDIAALAPLDGDILQHVTGSWFSRSIAQLTTALGLFKGEVGLANVQNVDAAAHANHTGTQSADTLTDEVANKAYAAEQTKLAVVASGVTTNATAAQLRDRARHTGTQSADNLPAGTTYKDSVGLCSDGQSWCPVDSRSVGFQGQR